MANDIKLPSDFIHKHSVRARGGGKGRGQLPHPRKKLVMKYFQEKNSRRCVQKELHNFAR